jgi:ABC-type amino acid transport substrate-binding protein
MNNLIIVGADPFPPYQYYDDSGRVKGSDYDLVKKIFKNAGYEIEVKLDDWLLIENEVINKKIDAAFQVQHSIEREKKYFYSELLRSAVTEVVTGNEYLEIKSYDEISEKRLSIGVIANYSYGDSIDKIDSSLKMSFVSQTELLKAINDRIVDIGIFDKGVKEYIMQQEGISNIHSIKALEFIRPLYVVFSNEKLRNDFNEGMKVI